MSFDTFKRVLRSFNLNFLPFRCYTWLMVCDTSGMCINFTNKFTIIYFPYFIITLFYYFLNLFYIGAHAHMKLFWFHLLTKKASIFDVFWSIRIGYFGYAVSVDCRRSGSWSFFWGRPFLFAKWDTLHEDIAFSWRSLHRWIWLLHVVTE